MQGMGREGPRLSFPASRSVQEPAEADDAFDHRADGVVADLPGVAEVVPDHRAVAVEVPSFVRGIVAAQKLECRTTSSFLREARARSIASRVSFIRRPLSSLA